MHHDPRKPVQSKEQLEELLVAGLDSGEPEPVTDELWETLRKRALANVEVRRKG